MLRIFLLVIFYQQLAAANFLYFRLEGMESLFVLPDPGSFAGQSAEGASSLVAPKTKFGRAVEILDSYKKSMTDNSEFQQSLPADSLELMKLESAPDATGLKQRPKILVLANRAYDQTPVSKNLYQQRIAKIQEKFGPSAQVVVLPVGALSSMSPAEKELWVQRMGREFTAALLLGGADISPELYGAENWAARDPQLEVDRHEIEFAKLWIAQKKKPIYGICRGMQLLAVALGFKLKQHIENHGDGFFSEHRVLRLNPEQSREISRQNSPSSDSEKAISQRLKALIGQYWLKVPEAIKKVMSYHHQAVDWFSAPHLHSEVSITDIASDGTVEGFRNQSGLVFGNQYHVEFMASEGVPEIFDQLIAKGLRIEKAPRFCSQAQSF